MDEFRVIFANVDGLGNGPKMGQLKETTRNDHMLLLNETNYGEKDAQLLTANGLGCIAAIRALDNFTFKNGKRVEPTRKVKQTNGSYKNVKCRKKSGFGSAIISKLEKGVEIFTCKQEEEILWANVKLNGTDGLVLSGYRSPSSKTDKDISNFYNTCSDIIQKNKAGLDFIIYAADDNAYKHSSCPASRKAAAMGQIRDTESEYVTHFKRVKHSLLLVFK